MDLQAGLLQSVSSLQGWVSRNGWAGYDPYDIQQWRFALPASLRNLAPFHWPLAAMVRVAQMAPHLSRRLFVPRRIYPKAMGLFAHAYAILSDSHGDANYGKMAAECASWLLDHGSPGYQGLGWGLPFDWQSRTVIPAGTPCATVSAVCGDAFFELYLRTKDDEHLDTCLRICRGFEVDLNADGVGPDAVCFSYTPLDRFHVHNANLMVAAFLAKVGRAADRADLVDLANRAGNYALGEQREDGSLDYWGRDQSEGLQQDVYHSGFEIRALDSLARSTGRTEFSEAAARYFDFFRQVYFGEDGAARRNPGDPEVIDIHGCAEAMICCAQMASERPEAMELLVKTAKWTIDNMQLPEGWFAYRLISRHGRTRRIELPFIRWGQAWMMRALAATMEVIDYRNNAPLKRGPGPQVDGDSD